MSAKRRVGSISNIDFEEALIKFKVYQNRTPEEKKHHFLMEFLENRKMKWTRFIALVMFFCYTIKLKE